MSKKIRLFLDQMIDIVVAQSLRVEDFDVQCKGLSRGLQTMLTYQEMLRLMCGIIHFLLPLYKKASPSL